MSEVRRTNGETLCQAGQQSGQGILVLQQIHRDGLHRQQKHTESVINVTDGNDVNNVIIVNNVTLVNNVNNVTLVIDVAIVSNVSNVNNERAVKGHADFGTNVRPKSAWPFTAEQPPCHSNVSKP